MMEASSDCPLLPEDLIIDILLRLPVKSLLQCKSVCKNWLALIESPSFINKHFHHESNHTNLLVYWHGFRNHGGFLKPDDHTHAFTLFLDETLERREEPEHLKMPAVITQVWGRIRGPCRGIFFLLNEYYEMALWNPATGRMRQLPAIPDYFPEHNEIGFGVDPLTDEFKIVVIDAGSELYEPMRPCYSLYTSGNDCWRFLENETLRECGNRDVVVQQIQCGTTFLNGFYYWRKFTPYAYTSGILAFDMHKEVFEEIEIPDITGLRSNGDLSIYNDSLVIICYDGYDESDKESIDIWVMKEKGCWTKLLTAITPFKICWTLGFWKNHEIFIVDKDFELIIWDIDSDDTKNLRVGKTGLRSGHHVSPFYYKESLISVKGEGHGCQDFDIHSAVSKPFFFGN